MGRIYFYDPITKKSFHSCSYAELTPHLAYPIDQKWTYNQLEKHGLIPYIRENLSGRKIEKKWKNKGPSSRLTVDMDGTVHSVVPVVPRQNVDLEADLFVELGGFNNFDLLFETTDEGLDHDSYLQIVLKKVDKEIGYATLDRDHGKKWTKDTRNKLRLKLKANDYLENLTGCTLEIEMIRHVNSKWKFNLSTQALPDKEVSQSEAVEINGKGAPETVVIDLR